MLTSLQGHSLCCVRSSNVSLSPPQTYASCFVLLFFFWAGTGPSKRLNAEQQRLVASPMNELDTILALLAAAAPVDVMPG